VAQAVVMTMERSQAHHPCETRPFIGYAGRVQSPLHSPDCGTMTGRIRTKSRCP
jgi:hypothetical protein